MLFGSSMTKQTRLRKVLPDHAAFRFVPVAVEKCGHGVVGNCKEAAQFVTRPAVGDIAAEHGRISTGVPVYTR